MPPELASVLTQAAKQLGTTTDRLWPQLVLITYVTAIFWLIETFVVCIAVTIATVLIGMKISRDGAKTITDNEYRLVFNLFVWGCAVLIILIAWGNGISGLPSDVAGIAAPEAKTAIDLVKLISGK